jgi:hypothetical protein
MSFFNLGKGGFYGGTFEDKRGRYFCYSGVNMSKLGVNESKRGVIIGY